jgi:hypothetical protein
MSKKTMMKARTGLKKAKGKLAALQRRARKDAARMAAALKRQQRAVKNATKRLKGARK